MSDDVERETVTFAEIVAGTNAARFETHGYDIVELEWVDGGLHIGAVPPEGES